METFTNLKQTKIIRMILISTNHYSPDPALTLVTMSSFNVLFHIWAVSKVFIHRFNIQVKIKITKCKTLKLFEESPVFLASKGYTTKSTI